MSTPEPDKMLVQSMAQIDALLGRVEQIGDPAVRESVMDMIRSLLEFHGRALARMLEIIARRGDQGREMLEALESDQAISAVLLVHNLHPRGIADRVQRALEEVRPWLAAHHGGVELIEVTPQQVVRLRLGGDCRECPASRATLSNLIEEAIYMAAPEVVAIEVEGAASADAAPAANSSRELQVLTGWGLGCKVGLPPVSKGRS